ncbi:VOC family protein [Crassaminicella profunda]|uniref:VOC family protein n=1 Tax=Crassaminicella profunda TaxID=1286698 RepID=UPI001CA7830E|nr:VOC family protein [Crassaminicella profunda]QZY56440.1 glyoxalase/bleomycin resistance/dioxygenase family protein [Crassaminicella profunda]
MKFKCPLIVVNNMHVARNFYENILNQKVKYDFGENVMYEGDFAIQLKSHFANMITINQGDIAIKPNNFELYFEEENIDSFIERLKNTNGLKYIHNLIEHPWGQKVIRFYDPDMHIIEVGESMESVVKRFLSQGLSVEETAKRTQHPIEFVRKCL